ncbi:terpene synthase family protein [Streptomyces sp. TLI_171]|uniref:terpene synthase family protein n=1 Tax=Streptomyces sp. TLI_171 TaxID=1938859 RepID=UPI000E746AE6|nr:hypothetical protein [Streptomyces sp. TLI_171]RKE22135.1 hypothetical protein BX266_5562 [Streptomyces sp. TLI_171]
MSPAPIAAADAQAPRLYCPVPEAVHPDAAGIDRRTVDWLRAHALYSDPWQLHAAERARPGLLAARCLPSGEPARVQLFADFHTWALAFDDEYCDEAAPSALPLPEWTRYLHALARVVDTSDLGPLGADPHAGALHELERRVRELGHPVQRMRWRAALCQWFMALIWEAQTRDGSVRPTFDDYLLLRLHNGAVQAGLVLLDMVGGYVLPSQVAEQPAVRALADMTCALVGWDNDLFSWYKEKRDGPPGQLNLVDVLAVEHGLDHAGAVRAAVEMRNAVMVRFLDATSRAGTEAGPELLRHIAALRQRVRANLDFGRTSARYARPGEPDAILARRAESVGARTGQAGPGTDGPVFTRWWHEDTSVS